MTFHKAFSIALIGLLFFSSRAVAQQAPTSNYGLTTEEVIKIADDLRQDTSRTEAKAAGEAGYVMPFTGIRVLSSISHAESYYNIQNNNFFSNPLLSYSDKGGLLYAELYNDYIWLTSLFGYGRAGFSSALQNRDEASAPNDETENTETAGAAERFFRGGGNASFYIHTPLLSYASFTHDPTLSADSSEQVFNTARIDLVLLPRVATDLPGLDESVDDPSFHLDLGTELRGVFGSVYSIFRFAGNLRIGWVKGFTDDFYQQLGHEDETSFLYGKWEVGMDIGDQFRISVSNVFVPVSPEFLTNQISPAISVQVIPSVKDSTDS